MMKGMDIFCASQAATAICLSNMDEASSSNNPSSSSTSTTIQLGSSGRAIDRYNPIIRDPRRIGRPLNSASNKEVHNSQIFKYQNLSNSKTEIINEANNKDKKKKKKKKKNIRKSSDIISKPSDENRKSSGGADPNPSISTRKSWSCSKPSGDFISPPSSSRYLLSDQAFLNVISDFDPVLKLEPSKSQALRSHDSSASKPSSNSSTSPNNPDQVQVVVLRVSLHCRGCERKMRKHISRMEGVSSFNIDFAAKKVTVIGNVTPLSVLASISKVKNAQLWSVPASAAAAPPSSVSPPPKQSTSAYEITKFESAGPSLL